MYYYYDWMNEWMIQLCAYHYGWFVLIVCSININLNHLSAVAVKPHFTKHSNLSYSSSYILHKLGWNVGKEWVNSSISRCSAAGPPTVWSTPTPSRPPGPSTSASSCRPTPTKELRSGRLLPRYRRDDEGICHRVIIRQLSGCNSLLITSNSITDMLHVVVIITTLSVMPEWAWVCGAVGGVFLHWQAGDGLCEWISGPHSASRPPWRSHLRVRS